MRIRDRAVRISVAAAVFALATPAAAQDMPDKPPQPKPPAAQPKPPQPKPPAAQPKPPKQPEAKPPEPPPAPPTPPAPPPALSPDEPCQKAGGKWTGTACDMSAASFEAARKACEVAGNVWDAIARMCSPKPSCPAGKKWNGTECVADCAEGERYEQARGCVAAAAAAVPAPAASPSTAPAAAPGPSAVAERREPGPWRTVSIVSGGVLLGVGVATGIVALSKKSSFSEQCNDAKQCFPGAKTDYDTGYALSGVSTGTLVAGSALVALGLFVLPSGGSGGAEQAGQVRLRVGLGSGEASVRF